MTQAIPNTSKQSVWIALFFALTILLGFLLPGRAHAKNLDPHLIKAAFTLNFAKFTQWPEAAFAGPAAPIELCVWGGRDIHRAFANIDGKAVGSRKLHVRFMNSEEMANNCQMMFIGKDVDRTLLIKLLAATNGRQVLTIGESSDFIQLGGAINVFQKNDRLLFEVKPVTIKQQKLKLSSRLLKLAIIVGD